MTGSDLRCRLVAGLKPVDDAIVGNHPDTPMYAILDIVKPDIIALGYDQEHAEERIRRDLLERGYANINVHRVSGLSDDLDGTRKIIARILEMRTQKEDE